MLPPRPLPIPVPSVSVSVSVRDGIGADVPPMRPPGPGADVNEGEAAWPKPQHKGVVGPRAHRHAPPRVGACGRVRGHVIHATVGPPVGEAAVVGHHGHEHVVLRLPRPPGPGLRDEGGAPGGALARLLTPALGEGDRQLLEARAGVPGPGRLTLTQPGHQAAIEGTEARPRITEPSWVTSIILKVRSKRSIL